MIDIVERLRKRNEYKAATVIERLRSLNSKLVAALDAVDKGACIWCADLARAALAKVKK